MKEGDGVGTIGGIESRIPAERRSNRHGISREFPGIAVSERKKRDLHQVRGEGGSKKRGARNWFAPSGQD